MYDTFNTIQYPLAVFAHQDTGLAPPAIDALKAHLVDFKIQLYSKHIVNHVFGYLVKIETTDSNLSFEFEFKTTFNDSTEFNAFGTLTLTFDLTQPYAAQDKVRAYFDSTDFEQLDAKITAVEGYICVDKLTDFKAKLAATGSTSTINNVILEPTTITVIGNHRVDNFRCQFAKPLLLQTAAATYTDLSEPVAGAVNFIGGANCAISLQQFSNTLVISAIKNVNGSDEERCGVWANKIDSVRDVLCNEPAYSLGGINPDDSGNLNLIGEYPFAVTPLTLNQLPPPFQPLANGFPHISKFLFVGLPGGSTNAACDLDPSTLPNPCN